MAAACPIVATDQKSSAPASTSFTPWRSMIRPHTAKPTE
jgi:hypothetical protein